MGTFVSGDIGTFDALLYGAPDQGTLNFIHSQMSAPSRVLESARSFFETQTQALYQAFSSSDAVRKAQALMRTVTHAWDQDIIRPLYDLSDLQQAKYQMQRWVMACPEVRDAYQAGRISGYAGDYIDVEPGARLNDHYDYRRAMNGLMQDYVNEAGEDCWKAVTYLDDLRDQDIPLSLADQVEVQQTWDIIRRHIKRREVDPTSKYNEMMG